MLAASDFSSFQPFNIRAKKGAIAGAVWGGFIGFGGDFFLNVAGVRTTLLLTTLGGVGGGLWGWTRDCQKGTYTALVIFTTL